MNCASCVGHVERAVGAVPGVQSATVNLLTERVTLVLTEAVPESRLVRAIEAAGYGVALAPADARGVADGSQASKPPGHAATEQESQRLNRHFWTALGLSLPLVVLGMAHGLVPAAAMGTARLVQLVLGTSVLVGPGRRFFVGGFARLRRGGADMNSLVALGIGSAWCYSTVAVLAPQLFADQLPELHPLLPNVYFEAVGAITTFVLLGKLLENRARTRLSDAVRALVAQTPVKAHRLESSPKGDVESEVAIEALSTGQRFVVRPGERMPTDGVVIEGRSAVDESMLTGESAPIEKQPGATVYGGTQNQSGSLVVRVTRVGTATTLARIIEAVESAQGSKAPSARLADVVASVFVPVVLGIALVTLLGWLKVDSSGHGVAVAVERFVAVLVIACPCALGLATPAAVAVATGRGAELGILFRGGEALEAASHVDFVFLDKTGTLTSGKPEVTDIFPQDGLSEVELLSFGAAVEERSEHPLARAVVRCARERGLSLGAVTDFQNEPGHGVEARVDGRLVRVGTDRWMTAKEIELGASMAVAEKLSIAAKTVIFVAIDGCIAGVIGVADKPAPEARAVVAQLLSVGIRVAMLTGDRERTARAIAAEVGIRDVTAEVLPEGKAALVRARRERGDRVAMVGDGINDAPALAVAEVGVAVSGAADLAVTTADLALLRGGIRSLPVALALARAAMRTIRVNLFLASVYNVLAIPIAAGALYRFTGWQLSPVLASAAMSLSSVSVLTNSLGLRRFGRTKV